jgi:carbon storage regulator
VTSPASREVRSQAKRTSRPYKTSPRAPATLSGNRTYEVLAGMLIFTRRVGQTVTIGNDVTVHVLGMKGGHVRVGVTAHKEIPVHRGEVYDRIKQEQESAEISRKQSSPEMPLPSESY